MSEPEHIREARRWLQYAREDLEAAEHVPDDRTMAPRHGCLLAQQAAEKALKTVLIFLQVDYPYRHDLERLRNLIPAGWEIRTGHPYLSDLTDWAVESRYPGDWPDATEADARLAAEQARTVYECVLRDLAEHGFDVGRQP